MRSARAACMRFTQCSRPPLATLPVPKQSAYSFECISSWRQSCSPLKALIACKSPSCAAQSCQAGTTDARLQRAAAVAAAACAVAVVAEDKAQAADPPPRRFDGKTILISGAGGTFGREGSLYFAAAGANIIAVDAAEAALKQTIDAVKLAHPNARCIGLVCDIRNAASVSAAVQAGIDAFGKIDLCWNNAGVQATHAHKQIEGEMKPTLEYPLDDFQEVMDINVVGSFIMLQAVSSSMASTGGGAIVNTASVAALQCTPTMVAYVASKAAVLGMTVAAAKDLAPHGIRVNAVSPALIGPGFMWERQNALHAASGSPYFANDADAVAEAKVSAVPLKRLGTTAEVVATVAFLLSEEASYTTGANLVVSGGAA